MKVASSVTCAMAALLIAVPAAAQTGTAPANDATSVPSGSSAANPSNNGARAKQGLHVKQGQSRKQTFAALDANYDGFISHGEAQTDPNLVILFVETDADNDGRL